MGEKTDFSPTHSKDNRFPQLYSFPKMKSMAITTTTAIYLRYFLINPIEAATDFIIALTAILQMEGFGMIMQV